MKRRAGLSALRTAAPAAVVAVGAAAIRVPTLLSPKAASFDEGVYGVSVLAMRAGETPFRDVFSSQGPLFLPILWLFDLIGLRRMWAPRLAMVAAGVAVALGTYVIARRFGSTVQATIAGLVVATSGSVLAAAGPLQSDGIALAFAVWAVALALGAGRLDRSRPFAVGALLGAGIAVKSVFLVPAGLAVVWVYWRSRDPGSLTRAAGTGVAVLVVAALPWGIGAVWDQYVAFQLEVPRDRDPAGGFLFALESFRDREIPLLVLSGLALAALGLRRRLRGPPAAAGERTAVLVWLASTALLLIFGVEFNTGFLRFLGFLIPPAAVAAVIAGPPALIVALLALSFVPRHLHENDDVVWRHELSTIEREVVAVFRSLPGETVISDDPGLLWSAGRRPPPQLVDPSFARIFAASLTTEDVATAAMEPGNCAVYYGTGRFYSLSPPLLTDLDEYVLFQAWGERRLLYVREGCSPP